MSNWITEACAFMRDIDNMLGLIGLKRKDKDRARFYCPKCDTKHALLLHDYIYKPDSYEPEVMTYKCRECGFEISDKALEAHLNTGSRK